MTKYLYKNYLCTKDPYEAKYQLLIKMANELTKEKVQD